MATRTAVKLINKRNGSQAVDNIQSWQNGGNALTLRPMQANHAKAVEAILNNSAVACQRLNEFTAKVFQTRGGRIGSGMGGVIEALWGFFLNQLLAEKSGHDSELAWMYGHGYNDFACIQRGADWDPETREGELLRVEVKSMVASADESKAHFDRLQKELNDTDLLVVFLWDWVAGKDINSNRFARVSPQVKDYFIGKAGDIAILRDMLHIARGGKFVVAGKCPDKCGGLACNHIGEPLNANGKRERLSGPEKARVSKTVSYAANFGGLVRMLKCDSPNARKIFRELCRDNDTAWNFVSFIHRNLPKEEDNQYLKGDWVEVAKRIGLQDLPAKQSALVERIRSAGDQYRTALRALT